MPEKSHCLQVILLSLQAAEAPIASTQRLLLITAFNIFGWTGACQRTDYKAMRPMDHETFDYVSAELGFSFLIEFVSNLLQPFSQADDKYCDFPSHGSHLHSLCCGNVMQGNAL